MILLDIITVLLKLKLQCPMPSH